ncbi:MAG: hypothetical protein IKZ48_09695 [Prevotella sp.]|nr:hypothetical protein [Prevotella sp.]
MQLSDDFVRETRAIMGPERFERYLKAFEEEAPVSIRLNPRYSTHYTLNSQPSPVPWCPAGFYLPTRPQFTFDPLLHAGCYYVQEASSMFLDEVLRQHLPHQPVIFLDMCAAPGGKSTLIRSAISDDSILVSNEPMRKRAQILSENIEKWGYPNCYVTNNYPKDFRKAGLMFDAILCDVPCSGEGMFRKDEATISEWSLQNVERCSQLQREIVAEAWQCLLPGGLLVYSTCTFNIKENEENLRWILHEFNAEVLSVDIMSEWGITGSLLPGFDVPIYRFIPGITRGEGLFMAVMRKGGQSPKQEGSRYAAITKKLERMNPIVPLSLRNGTESETSANLDYPTAISYLRGEAIVLPPDVPRGLITVSFMGQPLGLVKNIGSRANNLYPKEWRIKSTHIPPYPNIIKETFQ